MCLFDEIHLLTIFNHSSPISTLSYTLFEENRSNNTQDRERKRSGDGRMDTLHKFSNGG